MERRVGAYALRREIGRGGAGVVWEALAPEGPVAIKLLSRLSEERRARFDRERRLSAQLSLVDGFVPVLDVGESSAGPYLVMPLLEGGTLRQRLARGPLPVAEVVDLGARVAEALGRAHALGIVHRDLKPENVLFDARGAPLVADLGLAKHFDQGAPGASHSVSLSVGGEVRGTAGYMAPEQIGDAKTAGPAADVFAVGAILWECLAGYPAFPGQNVVEVLRRVAAGLRDDLRQVRPDAPAWLTAAVEGALDPDPARRPADGAALAAALRGQRPAGARGSPLRRSAPVVALLALVAVAGLAWRPGSAPAPAPARGELAALASRAQELAERGDLAGAVEAYTRLLEARPGVAGAWHNRGHLRAQLGDTPAALADLSRAIELAPRDAVAYFSRGLLRSRSGDPQGAWADYTQALTLDPRHARAWCNRGNLALDRGDGAGALADYSRAIEVDPGLVDAWLNRAELLARRGDLPGAVADLTRAIELDPGSAQAWHRRGYFRAFLDDPEGALADHTRALTADPSYADAWCSRGVLRVQRGQLQAGRSDLVRATEVDPRHAESWQHLGTLEAQEGHTARALDCYSRSIELEPRRGETWLGRGIVKQQAGDVEGALADYSSAVEIDPLEARAWCNRGYLRAERGDAEGARADYERALELDPQLANAWLSRGNLRAKAGDLPGALTDLRRALELGLPGGQARAVRQRVEAIEQELARPR